MKEQKVVHVRQKMKQSVDRQVASFGQVVQTDDSGGVAHAAVCKSEDEDVLVVRCIGVCRKPVQRQEPSIDINANLGLGEFAKVMDFLPGGVDGWAFDCIT